jgi:hypothetical protein
MISLSLTPEQCTLLPDDSDVAFYEENGYYISKEGPSDLGHGSRQAGRGALRRGAGGRGEDALRHGSPRQGARLVGEGPADLPGANRPRRTGHGHASRHAVLVHDHPGSVPGHPRAGALGAGGESLISDMGQPVKIVGLARARTSRSA